MKVLKVILLILAIVLTTLLLLYSVYFLTTSWMIGKTSLEIEDTFGEFDQLEMPPNSDGSYTNTICSYNITPGFKGFLSYHHPILLSIQFDQNAIAIDIFFEKGGKGG